MALTQLVHTYLVKRLSRKYFDRLCTYHRYRHEKLTQMRIVFRRHMTRIIFKFFEQMRYMVEKSHAKRFIVRPMVERRELVVKARCLRAVYTYAYKRQKER